MVVYDKPTELTDAEQWEIIVEMTSNMDPDEREDFLESWGVIK